jgi:putative heme-binding domain-containing protein
MLREHIERALATLQDGALDEAARRQAVDLLGALPLPQSSETLSGLLDPRTPQSLQIAAVRALANHAEPEIAGLLLDHWREYPPDVRKEVIAALLSRDARCEVFLRRAAADADIVNQIDAAQRTMLLGSRNESIRTLAQKLFSGDDRPRQAVIDAYRPALESAGFSDQGREVFTANCSACHKIGDVGTALGPDLTTSQNRTPDVLLTHILDPNRYVLPNYVQYVVLDATGRTYTGMMTAQTATSVTLQREKGAADTLLRANIDEIASTGKSMMPEGLEKSISVAQMADLLVFLQQSRGPAAGEDDLQTRNFGTLPGLIEPPDAK